jgi:hypothetical protein
MSRYSWLVKSCAHDEASREGRKVESCWLVPTIRADVYLVSGWCEATFCTGAGSAGLSINHYALRTRRFLSYVA